MKYAIVVLFMFILFPLGISQVRPDFVSVHAGPDIKLRKKEIIDKIIGKDSEGYYMLSLYGTTITIMYFDNEMNLVKKNTTSLVFGKEKHGYLGVVQMGDEFYLFTTYRNTNMKTTSLFSYQLNKQTLSFEQRKLISQESYKGYKKQKSITYNFTVSADSNYLLFVSDLPVSSDKRGFDRFGLFVYDKDMKEVWTRRDISVGVTERNFVRYSVQIGADEKVYILAKIYDSSRKVNRGVINYTFQMYVYSDEDDEPEIIDVSLQEKYMSEVTLELLKDGYIQVIGFYSSSGKGQDGVFNMTVDIDDYSVVNVEITDFPLEFIYQHYSDKRKQRAEKKEKKGDEMKFHNYFIDQLVENEDGTVTMIGEQYYYYERCTTMNGYRNCVLNYVYGGIIIVKFDINGVVEWMELIPKYQHTVNDRGYFSSYSIARLADDALILVFNDDARNQYFGTSNNNLYRWRGNIKETEVVMYKIKPDGRTNRYALFNVQDGGLFFIRPSASVQFGRDELIMLGYRRYTKSVRLFKLTFD